MTHFPDVDIYLQTDKEERNSEFIHIARVPMTHNPTRGDIINIRDYYFEDIVTDLPARLKEKFLSVPYLFVERVVLSFYEATDDKQAQEKTYLIVTFKHMPSFFL